jgi:hypothetical protein
MPLAWLTLETMNPHDFIALSFDPINSYDTISFLAPLFRVHKNWFHLCG